MNAGITVLKKLNAGVFKKLEKISEKIYNGIIKNIEETNTNAIVNRIGSMMTLFFTDKSEINNYDDAVQCDVKKYAKYFKYMLDMGIYLPPSQYECCFFSLALSDSDITKILRANKIALQKI